MRRFVLHRPPVSVPRLRSIRRLNAEIARLQGLRAKHGGRHE